MQEAYPKLSRVLNRLETPQGVTREEAAFFTEFSGHNEPIGAFSDFLALSIRK